MYADEKMIRQAKEEDFLRDLWPLLKDKFNGREITFGYALDSEVFGTIHIHPKADRLLIRRRGKWKCNANQWIKDNLI